MEQNGLKSCETVEQGRVESEPLKGVKTETMKVNGETENETVPCILENNSVEQENVPTKRNVWKLYTSRMLTAWGDRLWAFGYGLFLFKMQPTNLMLVAGYGLAMSLCDIIFLASIGNWIDRTERLKAAQILLLVQNVSVMFDCVLLGGFFFFRETIIDSEYSDWLPQVVAAVIMVTALIANLASHGSRIVAEKDWIVVIAGEDDHKLAELNANFRTIDLSCQTFAPILAGLLFSYASYVIAAAVIGIWNVISVILEYALLVSIYKEYTELGRKAPVKTDVKKENWIQTQVKSSLKGWSIYMTHDIRNAGLALSFLYMTVLGFDNITWSYSLLQCVKEWVLGMLVAISGLVGIAGSRTFPALRSKLGLEKSGVIGMSLLLFSLSFCVISIWLPGTVFDPTWSWTNIPANSSLEFNSTDVKIRDCSVTMGYENFISVGVMLFGIMLARFGLWVTDLSITQILQENVEENRRGIIGGVQTSLNSSMNLIKFVCVLFLPNPRTFGFLILISYTFITSGALLLTLYGFQKKKLCCQGEYRTTDTTEPEPSPSKSSPSSTTQRNPEYTKT